MALPSIPPATLPSAATLTSSELYTQTLAAEADVLKAAQAWPLLVNSLTDMTNPPARQQLAIVGIVDNSPKRLKLKRIKLERLKPQKA